MKTIQQLNNQQLKQYTYLTSLLNRAPKSEAQLQSKCAELMYFFYPNDWKRLVCVHNNSIRANTQGFGIVPGASDMYFIADQGRTIYIEFKFGSNKQSPDQIEFEALLKRLGHTYVLCYTEAEFWNIVSFNQPNEADILNLDWFK